LNIFHFPSDPKSKTAFTLNFFFYFISGYKNGGGKSSDFLICSIHPVDDEGLDVFFGGIKAAGETTL
jgi:hypothetical protein